jgi:hypothetical protein
VPRGLLLGDTRPNAPGSGFPCLKLPLQFSSASLNEDLEILSSEFVSDAGRFLQVSGQLQSAQAWPFLDPYSMFVKEGQVHGHDELALVFGTAHHSESIRAGFLQLVKTQVSKLHLPSPPARAGLFPRIRHA